MTIHYFVIIDGLPVLSALIFNKNHQLLRSISAFGNIQLMLLHAIERVNQCSLKLHSIISSEIISYFVSFSSTVCIWGYNICKVFELRNRQSTAGILHSLNSKHDHIMIRAWTQVQFTCLVSQKFTNLENSLTSQLTR